MFSELPTGRRIAMTALVSFCSAILLVTLIGGLSDMYTAIAQLSVKSLW